MKKNQFLKYTFVFLVAAFSVSFFSCKDDDNDEKKGGEQNTTVTEDDPEGTILANLQNNGKYQPHGWGYLDNGITLFRFDDRGYSDFELGINSSNNFIVGADVDYGIGRIVNVGKVKGIADIKKIPETGWWDELAVVPGEGYIYKGEYSSLTKYARIYVVDYITSTSGGIIGATIKYQPNWNPDENDEK